jgi:hypothetical protein
MALSILVIASTAFIAALLHRPFLPPLFFSSLSRIPGPNVYTPTKWRLARDDWSGVRVPFMICTYSTVLLFASGRMRFTSTRLPRCAPYMVQAVPSSGPASMQCSTCTAKRACSLSWCRRSRREDATGSTRLLEVCYAGKACIYHYLTKDQGLPGASGGDTSKRWHGGIFNTALLRHRCDHRIPVWDNRLWRYDGSDRSSGSCEPSERHYGPFQAAFSMVRCPPSDTDFVAVFQSWPS